MHRQIPVLMKKILLLSLLLACFSLQRGFSQNNIKVAYPSAASVPNELNVCGESDDVTIRVSLDGLELNKRQNIEATINLFRGVRFDGLISSTSSAGVSVINMSDPYRPVISIPELDPNGTTSIDVSFRVKADCGIIDTINTNNSVQVFDTWDFNYSVNGNFLSESDQTSEYRDAFLIPQITAAGNNPVNLTKLNECFTREILVTNSGLEGTVDTLLYSNTQGKGVYVNALRINGTSFPLDKSVLPSGDTLITAKIFGNYFEANTVGGAAGNGDAVFDPNEKMVIEEDVCVISCDDNRSSSHEITWGCYGMSCNIAKVNNFVAIGNGAANPVARNIGSVENVTVGYCENGVEAVVFTNDGTEIDPGFGTMFDVELGIGLGQIFELAIPGFEITEIKIAGIVINSPDSLTLLDGNPIFLNDPDGAGGLADVDGDGYYDDLPLNESIEIIAKYNYDCGISTSEDNLCANDVSFDISSKIFWTNACNLRLIKELNNFRHPTNRRSDFENFTDPDADITDGVFKVIHSQRRSVRDWVKNCNDGEQYVVTVELPVGVSLSTAQTKLIRNVTSEVPRIGINTIPGGVELIYDASFEPFINGDYQLELAFTSDCDAVAGPTSFPVKFEHYCPSCDCRHTWFCGELTGPRLHPSIPPCLEITDIDCSESVRTVDFNVERTTFGYTDGSFTTAVNPNTIDKKVAISCDMVEMTVTNVVGEDAISDSIGILITYDNVDRIVSNEEIFFFEDGQLRIETGGNTFFCDVSETNLTVTKTDSTKTLDFDLHQCLADLNVTLQPGDLIEFVGNFSINPEGPYRNNFKLVPSLRGSGYVVIDGSTNACDDYGDNFTIAKTGSLFSFPSANNFPTGCNETQLQYRILNNVRDFEEYFPNEFRQSSFVDSIRFEFDPAIAAAFSRFEVQVSIPGHPIHGDAFYDLPGFDNVPSGVYIAHFDTLNTVPSYNAESYSFNFRIKAIADCGSASASSRGDNIFNFDPTIYYRDLLYAAEIGDGECSQPKVEEINNDITYTLPPTFSFNPVTNPNHTLVGDTAEWIVKHCNTSTDSDAGLNWIAFENPNAAIDIVSIEDISIPSAPVDLTFTTYGSTGNNYFTYTPALKRVVSGNADFEICNTIRVRAVVAQCGVSEMQGITGWNCTEYDAPNWTPELYDPCETEVLPMALITEKPNLDADVVTQPTGENDFCEEITYEILLRNTDRGNAFDLIQEFYLPLLGADFVPNSFEIAYPSTAAYIPVTANPVMTGVNIRGETFELDNIESFHPYLLENGLPGFNPIAPSDSNELKLRFKFITSCGFVDGGLVSYSIEGLAGCRDTTNTEFGETLPIFIEGIDEDLTKLFDIKLGTASTINSTGSGLMEVVVKNLTSSNTGTEDRIQIKLPLGTSYIPNSTNGTLPNSYNPGEPELRDESGISVLTWPMPVGLGEDSEIRLTFGINVPPNLDCASDNVQISMLTFLRNQLECGSSGTLCNIEMSTTEGGEQFINLPIPGALMVDAGQDVNRCADGAAIQLNPSWTGGEGVLTFAWTPLEGLDNPSSQNPLASPSITTEYTFTVTDENGCTGSDKIIVGISASEDCIQCTPIDITGILIREATCGNSDGSVTINLNGNAADYEYDWMPDLGLANSVGNIRTQVPFGGYRLKIGSPDTDDCDVEKAFAVRNSDGPTLSSVSTSAASCSTADGSATLNPLNYSYKWEDGTEGNTRADLAFGIYFVTFTDPANPDCPNVEMITIAEDNPLEAGVVITQNSTCGNADGAATISVTGGSGNYTFQWSDGGSGASRTALRAGVYVINITDNAGDNCTTNFIFAMVDGDVPSANVTLNEVNDISCFGAGNGNISFSVSYSNSFDAPADTILTNGFNTVTNGELSAGLYCLTILDNAGCTAGAACFEIKEPEALAAIFSTTPSCLGGGTLSTTVTGGTGAYSFNWSDGESTGDRTALEAGNYSLTISDENGCTLINQNNIIIEPCDCEAIPMSSVTTLEATCGNSDGSATLNIQGEASNYNYEWSPSLGNPNMDGNTRMNLPFGAYSVTITDKSNAACQLVRTFFIRNEDGPRLTNITTSPASCAASNGSASLNPANYNYTWEDGVTGATRSDLAFGVYYVTFSNPAEPDCPNVDEIIILEDNPLVASANINQSSTCGNADGSATVSVQGGSGNYTFQWSDGGSGATRTDLRAGVYVVNIKDNGADACQTSFIFAIIDGDIAGATVNLTEVQDISCYGESDGNAVFDLSLSNDFNGPAVTTITNGFSNAVNGSLIAGQYCITVRDAAGCVGAAACFEIQEPEQIAVVFSTTSACEGTGEIEVRASGGTMPFVFDWADVDGTDNEQNREDLTAGNYFLTITDSRGCTWSDSSNPISLTCRECTGPNVLYTLITEATCGFTDGSAMVDLEEEESDYNFVWSPDLGLANEVGNKRTNLPAGGYVLTISEQNGSCSIEEYVLLTNKNGPSATIESIGEASCGTANGLVRLSPENFNYKWNDGGTGALRNDLAGGIYFVTFDDGVDTVCTNVLQVEVNDKVAFTITHAVDQEPDCGVSNGAVTVSAINGSGNYTFEWNDGNTNASRSNLSSGIYMLTVRDAANDCQDEYVFSLNDNVSGGSILVEEVIDESCEGAENGRAVFNISLSPDFALPANTIIINEDGMVFENGSLDAGSYCVQVRDGNNCLAISDCFEIDENLGIDLNIILAQATCETTQTSSLTLEILGGTEPYQFDWADLNGNDDPQNRDDLETGSYSVVITDANACALSIPSIDIECKPDCAFLGAMDSLQLTSFDCEELTSLCIPIPLIELSSYELIYDGGPYENGFEGCDFDTLLSYNYFALHDKGNSGPYTLESWTVGSETFSGSFTNITDLVNQMNEWDPNGNWQHIPNRFVITGGDTNNSYSIMRAYVTSVPDFAADIVYSIGFNAKGSKIFLDAGAHELILVNTASQCRDTLYTTVDCGPSPVLVIRDTIFVLADTVEVCLTPQELGLETGFASIENVCPEDSGTYVEFELDTVSFCVSYTGIEIGQENACIVFTDSLGNMALVDFIIDVIKPIPEDVIDTIFINQTVTHCLDMSQLEGEIVSVNNFCPELAGELVEFSLDTIDNSICVLYQGIEIGTEEACFEYCDSNGYCDTTYFEVTVIEFFDKPWAIDDYDTTMTNTPIVLDVFYNDSVFGGVVNFGIVDNPGNGMAEFNLDGTVTYIPDTDICGRTDEFRYRVCNPNGCDTASVFIYIECTGLTIFTAVSPNGDGINDYFHIEGIEEFPDNELTLYNRWGNEVYFKKGYNNEWGGTWNNNKDLPDGTYFYLLQLKDEDEREFKGYFQIFR